MTRDAEYWQRALAAFEYAKVATSEEDRVAWLRVARGFAALYRQKQSNEEELDGGCIAVGLNPHEAMSLN